MRDVCIVAEGAWPSRTGGIATWVQHLAAALSGAEVGVVSLGPAPWSSGEFAAPRGVREVDVVPRVRRLPAARLYLASGVETAEAALAASRPAGSRVLYVEHGDIVREALYGGLVAESGLRAPPGSRGAAAASLGRRRRAVARACDGVVGVTTATMRRVRREGVAKARCVPNAVPPAEALVHPSRRVGFVGRFSRVKGIDRFVTLARARGGVAVGMPAGERWAHPGIDWELARGCPWARADFTALAMPSRLEASPFAALEAEARGLPVILSARASLRESALVKRLPWARGRWGRALDEALRRGPSPELGARLAAGRWRRFASVWRAVVAEGPDALARRGARPCAW